MRKFIVLSMLIVCLPVVSAWAQNKVVFDNQSGEPALVKLIGPTRTDVEVPSGAKAGADAAPGHYIIKVRYGTPGRFHYAKGQEFNVTETSQTWSKTTITLHKVNVWNYNSRPQPITENEFAQENKVLLSGSRKESDGFSPCPPAQKAPDSHVDQAGALDSNRYLRIYAD